MKKIILFLLFTFCSFNTFAYLTYIKVTQTATTLTLWFDSDPPFGKGVMAQIKYVNSGSTLYTGFVAGEYSTVEAGANYKVVFPKVNTTSGGSGQIPFTATSLEREAAKSDYGTVNNGFEYTGFGAVGNGSLPVTFSAFSVKTLAKEVEISWTTQQEINNASFEVERSQSLNDWQLLAKLDGAGQSNTVKNYRLLDNSPKTGINYYRIKQNDSDGGVSYSRVKEAKIESTTETLIFPNPSAETITINGINALTHIGIFDAMGNNIQNQELSQDTSINIKHLKSGVYFLKLKDDSGTKTKRFVVE